MEIECLRFKEVSPNELQATRPSTPMAQSQLKLLKKLAMEDYMHAWMGLIGLMYIVYLSVTLFKAQNRQEKKTQKGMHARAKASTPSPKAKNQKKKKPTPKKEKEEDGKMIRKKKEGKQGEKRQYSVSAYGAAKSLFEVRLAFHVHA